ncbi:amidohydrolase family protein [Pigmentiphaga soli]|uniref:Amidohydrolase family protein n=1 Tax=Pigmentiphaga soli TaxID=1007095 RepID=A0ABP8GL47_9BURK
MRTAIKAPWIVGYANNGHTLIRDGVVVYEDERILYVGPRFDGTVDRTIDAAGRLVAPGFIDTHIHYGHRASHRLITDTGRPMYYGQPFLEVTVPKRGKQVTGDARWLAHGAKAPEGAVELNAAYTVAELIRGGVTTFVELGAQVAVQDALMEQVERFGSRAYLSPGYDCGHWVGDEQGRLERINDEERGVSGMKVALEWIERNDGALDGRIRGILVPRRLQTTSLDLMKQTVEIADHTGLPIATHAAFSVIEFHEIVAQHMMTPIELLDSIGMLRPTLNIGHCNYISDNPNMNYSSHRDLELLGRAGTSISHCPINIARRARTLDNWKKYSDAGVNITIGSDTYPRDMFMNMRTASYMGKIMSHSYFSATAGEVFAAATLGGAKSLGRDDIGRLEPGALADIITIDLTGRDTLRYGPVRDPVKSVIECGVGDDVDMVIVNGKTIMENRQIPGIDLDALRARAQASGEKVWSSLPQWDPLGRTDEQACPFCYPLAGK